MTRRGGRDDEAARSSVEIVAAEGPMTDPHEQPRQCQVPENFVLTVIG